MLTYNILPGTTDVSVVIRIVDSTDGTPETGVVFDTAGIDLEYRREGAASTDITEATLAALTTAHTDGGFLHIGNGYYRLDLPDAACATGVSGVLVHGTVTGMVVIGCYIQLESFVNSIYTRIGAPAGASVSADIAAIEAQTDDIGAAGAGLTAVPWNAAWDAEVQSEVQDAIEANNLDHIVGTATGIPAVVAGTYLDQIMDDGTAVYDRTTDSLQAVRDRGDAAWITATGFSTLDAAGVRSAVGLASANLDTQLDALPTAAENADAVWDEAQADHVGAGTFGEVATETAAILVDTGTTLDGKIDTIDANVDAILVDTGTTLQAELDGIQADTEDIQARLPAALVGGRIDASVGAMAANVMTAAAAAADLTTELQSGLATSAALATVDGIVDNLVSGIIFGAAVTGTLSTTQASTDLTGYANDQLIGRVIIWLSGACEGEASDLTDYVETNGVLTFTALTTAPANGDLFKIV